MNPPIPPPNLPAPTQLDRPGLRQAVKLGLDAILAGFTWWSCERIFVGIHASPTDTLRWVVMAMAVNVPFQLTRQHYRLFGFRDAVRLAAAGLTLMVISSAFMLLSLAPSDVFTLETLLAASLSTIGLWVSLRGFIRAQYEYGLRAVPATEGTTSHRSLIVGAGRAGLMIAQELKRHPELGARVIGFVDDALDKQGIRIQGIPVLGRSRQIKQIIQEEAATQVILAIPSATGTTIRQLHDAIRATGIEVKTVPGLFNLLGTQSWKPELRDISIEDLLRREPVKLDQGTLSMTFEDSVVLITGGGGSIGGELARQVAAFRPARIVLLGRGENSLWETERSLRFLFPNQTLSLELCDIRNIHRLQQVFNRWRPRVVLHAAAHKHVPYLEAHPEEAVENNIFGTENVLKAALSVGTHAFVNISTDKAVNPTNVLGASKRISESLVLRAAVAAPEFARFMSVRFGNVLGSRGSVIPVFKEQIQKGGPLTVTHPDMTRFFMTIPEASQLVLQASVLGDTAKVYVLDMGGPVKIMDLANDMARLSGLIPGRDIDIQFTGIRPGEKLFEELFTQQEQSCTDVHPKIFNANPEEMSDDLLEAGLAAFRLAVLEGEGARQTQILQWFKRMVPTYTPSLNGLGRFDEGARDRRASGSHAVYIPSISN